MHSPFHTSPCLAPARLSLVGVLVVSRGGQKRALVSRKPTVTPATPDPQSPSVEAISVFKGANTRNQSIMSRYPRRRLTVTLAICYTHKKILEASLDGSFSLLNWA